MLKIIAIIEVLFLCHASAASFALHNHMLHRPCSIALLLLLKLRGYVLFASHRSFTLVTVIYVAFFR